MSDHAPDPLSSLHQQAGQASSPPAETVGAGLGPGTASVLIPSLSRVLTPPRTAAELGWLTHYRVVKVLGQGGMGMVLQAEDTHLQRTVALKVILPEFAANPVARERFLREARTCAALKSDHVVTIYQVGQDRDIPFLAMEFLQGHSLEDLLNEGKPLPLAEVLRLGREIASGLAAAHAHGLVHRDIKPANIWLEAPLQRVKLLDFGLARAASSRSDLTQTGRVVGTPEFMSPEQANGEELDPRSDLFSLGVVLYAMCTATKPFQGDSVMAVLTALAVTTPLPVRRVNPTVPPALANLIERLLEKRPAERPASAEEVRDTLAAIETGAAVPRASQTRQRPDSATTIVPALRRPRRPIWVMPALYLAALVLFGILGYYLSDWFPGSAGRNHAGPTAVLSGPPIRIGALFSRTGTMALSERPVVDAILLAAEEINDKGGVLGRPVEVVLADGQSDEEVFAQEAERLIEKEKVCTIFGCWTSASRKAVIPVIERHNHLLYYPVQYEGLEQSPNVIYGGPVPNQQILPALRWFVGFEGRRRWFLVDSDYVFPATANAIIRDEAQARGCAIVGEEYLLLGDVSGIASVVQKILASQPELIVSTINGDSNVAFFRHLRQAGIKAKDIPALSFSISEEELGSLGPRVSAGDYVASNYFQSLALPQNQKFLQSFARRYGSERVISGAMETAYLGVYLWAQAVQSAGTTDPPAIRAAFLGEKFDAPQGPVQVDPATQHLVQIARLGQIDENGRLEEVYLSPQPIWPEPFPASRSREQWRKLLDSLHQHWGGRWSHPGP